MKFTIGKALAATVLACAMAATPAQADGWGRHGGWGGYHGGWGGARGWGGGWGHRHGGNWGAAAAAGALGLAAGAIAGAAAQPAYPAYGYGAYGGCYPVNQPVVDGWGRVLYYQRTEVCE